MEPSLVYVTIDLSDVDLNDEGKLPHSPQLDFAHEILYSLNKTSFWQCGRIRVFLEAKKVIIEVSPLLNVPSSLKEFRQSLKKILRGEEVKSSKTKLLTIRKNMKQLPKRRFTVSPHANKVIDPNSLVNSSVLLCLSLNDERGHYDHACFSKYPLSPLNQCMSVVSAYENANNIF